ncbi:hypothetical protein F5X99DRAFT_426507 [Biscogniauxia marginata]|nr:hypothetical protein F5X99DRAFT_426507 [Biscogniauxia marginata]
MTQLSKDEGDRELAVSTPLSTQTLLTLILITNHGTLTTAVPEPTYTPASLLKALLVPLTVQGVSKGCKIVGAAILFKEDLAALTAAMNNDAVSLLPHVEVY